MKASTTWLAFPKVLPQWKASSSSVILHLLNFWDWTSASTMAWTECSVPLVFPFFGHGPTSVMSIARPCNVDVGKKCDNNYLNSRILTSVVFFALQWKDFSIGKTLFTYSALHIEIITKNGKKNDCIILTSKLQWTRVATKSCCC